MYRMWYSASDGSTYRILSASSNDGIAWTKQGLVLDVGGPGTVDDLLVWDPAVLLTGGTYYMWYTGQSTADPPRAKILFATSPDGLTWSKQGVVLSPGSAGTLDQDYVANPAVRAVGSVFEMIYMGGSGGVQRLFFARSADLTAWEKLGLALDVLAPDESPTVVQPTFLVEANGDWSVYYAARGSSLRIYYATLAAAAEPGPAAAQSAPDQLLPWVIGAGTDAGALAVSAIALLTAWLKRRRSTVPTRIRQQMT